MQQSGHTALASQIAKADNHVYIERIKEGPALEWILLSGLTQEECTVIQPSYNWERPGPPLPIQPTEPAQLRQHFAAVHETLLSATKASLETAVKRLEPLIANGATIDRVAR